MELPRLSVVVPNYNHARFLPACLDALLAQSVVPDEILVIDDGSTDDSVAVMTAYAAREPRIRVLRNEVNRGVVATMNRGVDEVRFEYVFLQAADDAVRPGFVEKSLRLLAGHPGAALSCTVSEWRDTANGLTWLMAANVAAEPGYLSPDDLVRLERAGRLMIVSHASILRTAVVRELGGFRPELRWHCDWFVTYAGAFRYGLCFVPETLSQVNLHGSSYYGSGRRRSEHDEVMRALLGLLSEPRYWSDIGARVRDSGALALHGGPILRAMLGSPPHREFLTARFLAKCAWREAQLVARRFFPPWLARWCIRLFLHPRRS